MWASRKLPYYALFITPHCVIKQTLYTRKGNEKRLRNLLFIADPIKKNS